MAPRGSSADISDLELQISFDIFGVTPWAAVAHEVQLLHSKLLACDGPKIKNGTDLFQGDLGDEPLSSYVFELSLKPVLRDILT